MRVRKWTALWGFLAIFACGGKAQRQGPEAEDGTAGTPGLGAAGATGTAGVAGGISEGGEGGEDSNYVPAGPEVAPEGDGRLEEGGSFEQAQGFGWDTCPTRIPGLARSEGKASDGLVSLRFESQPVGATTNWPEGTDAQLGFYLSEPLLAGVPLSLYFDVINLSRGEPSGELSIAGLDWTCETREPLATIDLAELSTTEAWQTRCVELVPTQELTVFGIWVTGANFTIGLDTFRFGPPCR